MVCYACPQCFNAAILGVKDNAPFAQRFEGLADVRAIATPGSIGHEIMSTLRQSVKDLPVLPEISTRVMALVRDPDSSAADLADLITQDQVIAAKILQVANSAMYGGLQEIDDLKAACARLGMRTVANIAQAAASANLYEGRASQFSDMMHALWRHSIATAHCTNELAAALSEPKADALFVAGLLHDIGQIVLLDLISKSEGEAVSAVKESHELLNEVIQSYHPLAGFHVVLQWDLPPEFAVSTLCHHDPQMTPAEKWRTMTHIVCLADRIAREEGYGTLTEEEQVSLLAHPSTSYLGLSDIKLAGLRVDLEDRLESLLEVVGGE
jgi:HD-like signal output (HDOD) protein